MTDESMFRAAAEACDPNAMAHLGWLLVRDVTLIRKSRTRSSSPEGIEEGTAWLVRAAEAEHAGAMRRLAILAHLQDRPDEEKHWQRRADQTGDLHAIRHTWLAMGGKARQAEAAAYRQRMLPRLAEAGDETATRELAVQLARQGRHEEAERWFNWMSFEPFLDFQRLADELADQGQPHEARRWLRRAVATRDMHALAWAGRYEERQGDPAAAEHWYRQAIQARAEFAMVLLGRLLEGLGRLDEAETWLRSAPRSLGGEDLVAFLERRGRSDEAKRERERVLAARQQRLEHDDGSTEGAAPDLPTVVTSVLISAAVLPFVQTLAIKAAEGTYSAARALLARLAARYARNHRPAASTLLIIEDPTHGLKLHLRTDETDEALQALSALEQTIKESGGRRGVKLAWDPASKTWRTPPT
jgi:tetratricopeptide (TPR) repeat protein